MATFKAASKKQQKLRLAITGLAGSGKTFSALRIATGMGGKIAVIDSEHASSELYAARFSFDICPLKTYEIEEYVDAIESAGTAGYNVIVIDSLSHAWEKLLERVDNIADQRYRGNTFRAWAEGSELHKKLVETILSSPCHVIGTIRTKAEYAVDTESGKTKVTKLGTAPKQREGFEYELSVVMEMSQKHIGFISKDRTGKFQDKYIECPGEEFGQQLIAWLNEGTEPIQQATTDATSIRQKCVDRMKELKDIMLSISNTGSRYFTDAEYDEVKVSLNQLNNKSDAERLDTIFAITETNKMKLQDRIKYSIVNKPAEPPSLSDSFKKVVEEKQQKVNNLSKLELADNIPGVENREPVMADLDIF